MRTYIAGVGRYLPERVVTSEELEIEAGYEKFGLKPGICRMLSGCATRHVAAPEEACSDLATHAGREAMDRAGVSADEIDVVIFASVTQDFAEPATANRVADNLNIHNAYCFDIKNACNAFLQGIDIADSLIKTGKAKVVLLVSGEVFSRWIKHDYDDVEELKQAAPVALSLGDGGGAFVIRESPDETRGIQASVFHTDPTLWNNNVMWGGGVIYPRDPDKMYIPGTTQKIVAQIDRVIDDLIPECLEKSGWQAEDLDLMLPTQGATWLVNYVIRKTVYTADQVVNIVDHVGNVGASNVALVTYEAMERGLVKPGTKVILTSGGVGWSYAAISAVM